MAKKHFLIRRLAFLFLMVCAVLATVKAEDLTDCTFVETPLQDALKVISNQFGVTIIADPTLSGTINGTIHGNSTTEEALKTVIEPLGYYFTKVDNFYIISSSNSPLTIFAETESSLVPVGFLDPAVRDKLGEDNRYLVYNEKMGVAFVKAPTSLLNKILTKLWELSSASSEFSVLYNLQIVDLGNSSDLDYLFSYSYDSKKDDNYNIIVSPDELAIDSQAQLIIRNKIAQASFSMARQPWLVTLPGKTVELSSNVHYLGDSEHNLDESFLIKITPLKVDAMSGKVLSDVYIGKEEEKKGRLATTVRTSQGRPELLAVIRQSRLRPLRTVWGKRVVEEHRDFAVLLTATPVNIQTTLATTSGIIPIASLGGIDRLSDSEAVQIKPKSSLTLGFTYNEENNNNAWLNLNIPIGKQVTMKLDYRNSDLNSIGFSWEFEPAGGTYLDLTGGQGIGPDGEAAVMLGIGDQVQVTKYFSLFGAYYPGSYLIDTEEYITDRGVWNAGARLEFGKAGLTVKAFGNPDYEGLRLKMDIAARKHTYIFEAGNIEKDPTLYLGVGFNF